MHLLGLLAFALVTLAATPTLAYIGPGAGISLIGAFFGLALALVTALAVVIVWPVRRLLRRRRDPAPGATPTPHQADAPASSPTQPRA